MTKADLIKHLAARSGLTKAAATNAIDTLGEIIESALKTGDDINLFGLGKLEFHSRDARIGRNPNTGDAVEIPASNTVKFKPSASLKAAINK
jgi:DNA-binding protein HU-beta